MGLRCRNPPGHFSQLKAWTISLIYTPKWWRTLPSLIYFSWDIYRDPFHNKKSNIIDNIWHPTAGLRCRNPPRHLGQLKARAIPLIGTRSGQELSLPEYIFHRIFIENSLHKKKSNIKVDIRHSAVGLRCRNPPRHCSQLTTWLILLIETPNGQELCWL